MILGSSNTDQSIESMTTMTTILTTFIVLETVIIFTLQNIAPEDPAASDIQTDAKTDNQIKVADRNID